MNISIHLHLTNKFTNAIKMGMDEDNDEQRTISRAKSLHEM